MRSWYDLPLDSIPSDGASAAAGVFTTADPDEYETLMNAWLHERQENIELGLYLEQACALLRRLMVGPLTSPRARKRARDLIRAIEEARRTG